MSKKYHKSSNCAWALILDLGEEWGRLLGTAVELRLKVTSLSQPLFLFQKEKKKILLMRPL